MNNRFNDPRSPLTGAVATRSATRPWTAAMNSPDEVVADRTITLAEKRAVLAAWASDSHAVENAPALRRLDSGAIVPLDDILAALRQLDARHLDTSGSGIVYRFPFARHQKKLAARWRSLGRQPRGRDDDDDPPPAPAAAAPIPRKASFVAAYGEPMRLAVGA